MNEKEFRKYVEKQTDEEIIRALEDKSTLYSVRKIFEAEAIKRFSNIIKNKD